MNKCLTKQRKQRTEGMFWGQLKLSIREKFSTAPHPSNP